MGLMCVAILCFGITFVKGESNRSDEVFAIPGCNASLEWEIRSTYLTAYAHSINVFNASGIEIVAMEAMQCQQKMINSSMYCEVRNISVNESRLYLVLVNVTGANSGKYFGQIKYALKNETRTKQLKIIDKPQIREYQTPILHKPFSTKCKVDGKFDDLIYHWKLNGTYLNSTTRINASLSYLMFERLTMTDKFSLFSCTVCSGINCCVESEPYAPDPYYGPDNVPLSLNLSDVYLKVNEFFNITCLAKCHPVCSFMWDGYINSENEELTINRFDPRMDGVYECIATNPKTNETARSRPLFLHYVPDSSSFAFSPGVNGGYRVELLGLVLLIVAVLLVVIGLLASVTVWRKNASTGLAFRDPPPLYQPDLDPNIPKSSREITKKQDRPLPTPGVQEHKGVNVKRSNYPKVCRKSKSFSNLLDVTENVWSRVRQSSSLQTLIHLSHTTGRPTKSDESASKSCSSDTNSIEYKWEGPADGLGQEELLSKIQKNKKLINDDRINCANFLSLKCSGHGGFDPESQKDLYSTIDEAAVSITNYDRTDEPQENLPQNPQKGESGNLIYDYATLPALVRHANNTCHHCLAEN